jgi:DNA-directed RNA polymerase specialized sigma24 family protein
MQAFRAEGLAAAEIGRRLGLPRQTVHRIHGPRAIEKGGQSVGRKDGSGRRGCGR